MLLVRESGYLVEAMMTDDIDGMRRSAQLDQTMRALGTLASVVWSYYRQLLDVGFNEQQALALAVNYQTAIIAHISDNQPS